MSSDNTFYFLNLVDEMFAIVVIDITNKKNVILTHRSSILALDNKIRHDQNVAISVTLSRCEPFLMFFPSSSSNVVVKVDVNRTPVIQMNSLEPTKVHVMDTIRWCLN